MTTVTINPDKTISIDGKKTFYVAMTSICAPYNPLVNCDSQILINNNALSTNLTGDAVYSSSLRPKLIANNIYFTKGAFQSAEPNAPGLLAYWQPDEPTVGQNQYPITPDMTIEQIKALMLNNYNDKKLKDVNHPVVLNHWTSMTEWLPYADIMMWDAYAITYRAWQVGVWTREDAIYAWELLSWNAYFQGTELNRISKPVWTYIQANINDPSWQGYEPTKQEARANTYAAITLDVKGINYFGYMVMGDWTNVSTITGVYSNQILASYYNKLMGELRSFNDILVLPTIDYGWTHHPGTKVNFNKKYTKNVYWINTTNFNYILKQESNIYYLIIVNKDRRPILDVTITIQGLVGISTAKTLGIAEAGSIPGRTIPVTDGSFTDSFDGLAVHIYQIGLNNPCLPSQCNFTITQ